MKIEVALPLRAIICAGALAFGIAGSASALTTVSASLSDNDCKGVFAEGKHGYEPVDPVYDGFSSCQVWADDDTGTDILISPVIVKFDGSLGLDEVSGRFSSVTGGEFEFGDAVAENKSGSWSYSPDYDSGGLTTDPGVRFWAAKAGNGFELFWTVEDSALAAGGACEGLSDYFDLGCLQEATNAFSGNWFTPDAKELSHLTFYDSVLPRVVSEPPSAIPLPAGLPLVLTGLGVFGLASRRRKQG